ncbi:hypothetical protein [Bosea sp. (in: a-proteobacteria)]|uniref:hypothetical protein n=1 Tax=Bosea sp. (in: a-proteobacteria) TaxID=1871050 RepID=UPI002DDCE5ED|nr:hypothetical protein [Bosea sp. (in: a-proteobacteria)]HEV2508646.1 hypothetical protein [Bosea sp. (in: a-proteobacteria)]
MNKANHRAFARAEAPAKIHDPALIAAIKYRVIYNDYMVLAKTEGCSSEDKNLERMHERWAGALEKALATIPTTWPGVLALLEICTDNGSIGEDIDELKAGVNSISNGVRRLLSDEFKAA